MLYTSVFQQNFNAAFGVRKIKSIIRLHFKVKWERGLKGCIDKSKHLHVRVFTTVFCNQSPRLSID